jgi:hypothetical protein
MKKPVLLLSAMLLAAAANAQIANSGLDNWRSYTVGSTALEAPVSWHGLDSNIATFAPLVTPQKQVFKSTDRHGGSFAARLVSRSYAPPIGGNIIVPGIIVNGDISITIAPDVSYLIAGGTPVTQRHASVTSWVKYIPAAITDSATIVVGAILQGTPGADGRDSVIGEGIMTFNARASYTQMTVPIVYTNPTSSPTHIQIGFISGSLDAGADGSELFVDDVVLNAPQGIGQVAYKANVVSCYPNPTNGTLYLTSKSADVLTWEALNATGQVIAQQTFTGNAAVTLGHVPAGLYYFRVFDKNKMLVQTGKFGVE